MDRHAALLANESFTVEFEQSVARHDPEYASLLGGSSTWNGSRRALVDPEAGQFLLDSRGEWPYLGSLQNGSVYSNGTTTYVLKRTNTGSRVTMDSDARRLNRSSEQYLWTGWQQRMFNEPYQYISDNTSYERLGMETFRDAKVMRYEAVGVDALDGRSPAMTDFSATLLVDADGVIRRYRVEIAWEADNETLNVTVAHTVTDVGNTDVERPDWTSNATSGS